jgi:hypothetical protein
LADTFHESGYDMAAMLTTLFTSDFFKEAYFTKVKSPAELVVGTLRLVGGAELPRPDYGREVALQPTYMGQDLLNPPSVEGWHTGKEWINSGSLMSRINFVAEMVGSTDLLGVQDMIGRLRAKGPLDSDAFVDSCLDLMGPLQVGTDTRQELLEQAREGGLLAWDTADEVETSVARVGEMLQLIVAMREYQFN